MKRKVYQSPITSVTYVYTEMIIAGSGNISGTNVTDLGVGGSTGDNGVTSAAVKGNTTNIWENDDLGD